MGRRHGHLIFLAIFLVLSGSQGIGANTARLPVKIETPGPLGDLKTILDENALFFGTLTGIGVSLAIVDPAFGFDVVNINLNLITRGLRDSAGQQQVVARIGGVVRKNNNVEIDILDPQGSRAGRFFLGYQSGDLLFYNSSEQLIIRGFLDGAGRYTLQDLRLPAAENPLASGRFAWCGGCPGFNYTLQNRSGQLLSGGLIYYYAYFSSDYVIEKIRTAWYSQGGYFEPGTPAFVEAEYDLRKEAKGALNSNLFDRRPDVSSYFKHPQDLVPDAPALAWLPRVGNATLISVTNGAAREARVSITARHYDGALFQGEGITNPVTYLFDSGQQATAAAGEFLREFSGAPQRPLLPEGSLPLWIEIRADQEQVNVLYFEDQGDMDGAAATGTGERSLFLPGLHSESGLQLEISLLNPGYGNAFADLDALDDQGRVIARSEKFYIPARGFRNGFLGNLPGLFAGADLSRLAALRVVSDNDSKGIAAVVLRWSQDGSLEIIPGRRAAEASEELWFPFVVTGAAPPGRWRTVVSLLDPSGRESSMSCRIMTSNGVLVGSKDYRLSAFGSVSFEVGELLNTAAAGFSSGYLTVSGSTKLIGGVSYRYEGSRVSSGAYSKVAPYPADAIEIRQMAHGRLEGIDYYTGLALMNPNELPTRLEVTALDDRGQTTARTVFELPPAASRIALLSDLFGVAFSQFGGTMKIRGTRPFFVESLFGETGGWLLSSLPR